MIIEFNLIQNNRKNDIASGAIIKTQTVITLSAVSQYNHHGKPTTNKTGLKNSAYESG